MVDSSVVIAAERRGDNVTRMLKQILAATGDQRVVLSSVGLTELVHGIFRAQSATARNRRDSFIRELLNDLEIHPFTKKPRSWQVGSMESSKAVASRYPSAIYSSEQPRSKLAILF